MPSPSYKSQAIRPVACLETGFALVKEQYWIMVGITAVGILLASIVPLGILQGPMSCGIYLLLFARMRSERIEFNLLFRGFDYFVESLIATLIQLGLVLLVMLPALAGVFASFFFLGPRPRAEGQGHTAAPTVAFFAAIGLIGLATVALVLVIGVLCLFTYPLIVDRKLSGLEAVKCSIAAARSNF